MNFKNLFKNAAAFSLQAVSMMLIVTVIYALFTAFQIYGFNPATVAAAGIVVAAATRFFVPDVIKLFKFGNIRNTNN